MEYNEYGGIMSGITSVAWGKLFMLNQLLKIKHLQNKFQSLFYFFILNILNYSLENFNLIFGQVLMMNLFRLYLNSYIYALKNILIQSQRNTIL